MQRHLRNQIKETRGTKEESRESMRKNLDDAFHTKELAIVEWKKARSAPKISRIDVDVAIYKKELALAEWIVAHRNIKYARRRAAKANMEAKAKENDV